MADVGANTMLLQNIIKKADTPYKIAPTVIPYLKQFKDVPLLGNFRKRFRPTTATIQYPPELLIFLINNGNIKAEQLPKTVLRQLGIPIQGQLFTPAQLQQPIPPEVQEKAKKIRQKLREMFDLKIDNLTWNIEPKELVTNTDYPKNEFSTTTAMAKEKIGGQLYYFKVING